MNMILKGRVNGIGQGSGVSQAKFIEELFGVIDQGNEDDIDRLSLRYFCDTTV